MKMKKLEMIIRPEKVPVMKALLNECHAQGAMFTSISGYGNQRSKQYVFRGESYYEQIFPKTKVETVVNEEIAQKVIQKVLETLPTGEIGDGKIFVYNVEDVYRIRTGEEGEQAL